MELFNTLDSHSLLFTARGTLSSISLDEIIEIIKKNPDNAEQVQVHAI